ncbi:MAG: HTH-type transcriptional activator CmpR [Bacteroidota bacterium]|jgi:DNA-binding transcriptional LysR family regulator
MQYTFHQLKIFTRIAQLGSITKAAEELHLSQPALSIQLRNFQDQFDIPLTEIVGKKLYLTDFGQEILAYAERILDQAGAMDDVVQSYKGQLTGKLKIAVVSTGKYVMPYLLTDFLNAHPAITLELDVTNKEKVIESLEQNSIDFALVSLVPGHLKTESIPIVKNTMHLIGAYQSKKSQIELSINELQQLPWIFREQGSGTRQMMERFLSQRHITVQKMLELTSNEAVKQAIIANLGYSIMPLIGIKNELKNKQLMIVPVKGLPIHTTWRIIWLKGKKHSPVVKALLGYIKDNKKRILQEHFDIQDNMP